MGFRGRDAAPGAHRHADAVQLDFAQQTPGHRQQFGFFTSNVRLVEIGEGLDQCGVDDVARRLADAQELRAQCAPELLELAVVAAK